VKETSICYYFVDEAGDGILFDARGKVIIGTPGCSRYFLLGVLDVADPAGLSRQMDDLRTHLLTDPYFRNVPSMQPGAKKTATFFHATDDPPEVRREVFSILRNLDLKFMAVVRDKRRVVEYVRERNQSDAAYRYNPNELYDYMVRRLFMNMLHKKDEYEITFSKRGKTDRTASLYRALRAAKDRFTARWGIDREAQINVYPRPTPGNGGLQAVDYFMWSLQRFYERREDRYLEFLWPRFRLVHDIDDQRRDAYGVYYTSRKPLSIAAFE
jgi:hypothetical protein